MEKVLLLIKKWWSNKKKCKNTLIGVAEVSFYNHAYVKYLNHIFIEILLKLFKYSVGVPVCQKFDKTLAKNLSIKACFSEIYRSYAWI